MIWPARIAVLFLFLSVALVSPAQDPLADLEGRLRGAQSAQDVRSAIAAAPPVIREDPELKKGLDAAANDARRWESRRNAVVRSLELRRISTRPVATGRVDDAQATAKQILSGVQYADAGDRHQANWLSRAFQRVGEAIRSFLEWLLGLQQERPTSDRRFNFEALKPIVWGALLTALVFFLYLVGRHFRVGLIRRRATGGLLDEDEPNRTADEWLFYADACIASGELREAVRALYLACLVRLDDAGVAAFRRHETNWEHLRRIEAGKKLPSHLSVRPATVDFDRIWYGHRLRGIEEVEAFRTLYQAIAAFAQSKKEAA